MTLLEATLCHIGYLNLGITILYKDFIDPL